LPFVIPADEWINVPLTQSVAFHGDFYVMVHWSGTEDRTTNYIGCDWDGPNANLNLDMWIGSSGTWDVLHTVGEGAPCVLMIRANAKVAKSGKSNSINHTVLQPKAVKKASFVPEANEKPLFFNRSSVAGNPAKAGFDSGIRSLNSYNIYRGLRSDMANVDNWTPLNSNAVTAVSFTDNTFSQLEDGEYIYAVKAGYSNNRLAKPSFSNPLGMNMEVVYTVNVSTNSGDSPNGAIVKLTNKDGDAAHAYEMVVSNEAVVFPTVWKGTYDITISLPGFDLYHASNVLIDTEASYNVVLNEIIVKPYGLDINSENPKEMEFSWNNEIVLLDDDMEGHEDFIIENIGDYTLIDGDGVKTWEIAYDYDYSFIFLNNGYTGSYIVMNPYATEPMMTYMWLPHSGDKVIACHAANGADNNDWLILPKMLIKEEMIFRFMALTVQPGYGSERIKIGVSAEGTEQNDFKFIHEGNYIEVPSVWTEYSFDMSDFAGEEVYIAINCVSSNAFQLLIDNIFVGIDKGKSTRALNGYTVYLNDVEVADNVQDTKYVFSNLAKGNYTAGESPMATIDFKVEDVDIDSIDNLTPKPYPNPFTDEIMIANSSLVKRVQIVNAQGQIVKDVLFEGKSIPVGELNNGVYLVIIENYNNERAVYKMIK